MSTRSRKTEPFFTVIVPTRERSDTLMHTLKTALCQDYDGFQVLVSDNASADGTGEKVSSISDSRLKYVNTGQRVSMSENWEFALSHVDHGWVTVLGDDDALLPGALRKVSGIISATGTKAIRSNGCTFLWPGFNGAQYGKLSFSVKRGFEVRDSSRMLQKVLGGVRHYTELPMLYNGGYISFDLIKEAKGISGKFFLSMTPDVYSAIVLSLLSEKYVYSHEPLAVNGASSHSGGAAAFGLSKVDLTNDPAEKFWSESNIPFHDDFPVLGSGRPVRSIQVLVYEAYLQAQKFHAFKENVRTDRDQQLKLAIIQSGQDHSEIVRWAKLFSERHQLDLPKKYICARRFKSLRGRLDRLRDASNRYSLRGNSECPLQNVWEASVVAGAVGCMRPRLPSRLARHIYNQFQ